MPLRFGNRVREGSDTTGTGTLVLNGPSSGFRSFYAEIGDTNVVDYLALVGAEWEMGRGTVVSTVAISRDTVYASSNSDALVNFSSGPTVFNVQRKSVVQYGNLAGARITATNYPIGAASETVVVFDTEKHDTEDLVNLGANADRIFIPGGWDGIYAEGGVNVNVNGGGGGEVSIKVVRYNSAAAVQETWQQSFTNSGSIADAVGSFPIPPTLVASGDYFRCLVEHHTAAGTVNVDADFWVKASGSN